MEQERAAREKAVLPYIVAGVSCAGIVLAAKWIAEIKAALDRAKKENPPWGSEQG